MIWRYEFGFQGEFQIEMPRGAMILSVQTLGGIPCIWARVHPKRQSELRTFQLRGTGHTFNGTEGDFVGTFQMGPLVFHLFHHIGSEAG